MTDELEAMLRRALAEEADRVEPAGDGLRRIRERTARDRFRWRVPALALAGAAALVAALVAVPGVLPALRPSPPPSASAAAPPTSAGPSPTPPRGQYPPIPGAGVNDQPTVWPYASRRQGYEEGESDLAAGTYGDLTRADLVAIRFVGSYVGGQRLTAVSAGPWKAGLRMVVRWEDRPVSLVYLVRTRLGEDAPYVVVDATAPDGSLTLNRPPVPGTGPVTARGTVAGGELVPRVQLRTPGRDTPLAALPATVDGTRWSARFALPAGVRTAALTAWTVHPDGGLAAFTSLPLD